MAEYISGWKQRNAVKLAALESVVIFSSWPICCFILLVFRQFISEATRENMKASSVARTCHATPIKIRLEIKAIAV